MQIFEIVLAPIGATLFALNLPEELKSGVATFGAQSGKVHKSFNPAGYWIVIGAKISLITICACITIFGLWNLLVNKAR